MAAVRDFLRKGGWRFWLLWVAATNLAFFPGIALAGLLRGPVAPYFGSGPLNLALREALASSGVGILLGLLQTPLLKQHLPTLRGWPLSNVLGWPLGVFAGVALIERVAPGQPYTSLLYLVVVAAVIGAVVGIPQTLLLRRVLPAVGVGWIAASALAWAIQFPGIVTGTVLARLLRSDASPP